MEKTRSIEMEYVCSCGFSRVIDDSHASQLRQCERCRQINLMPGQREFREHFELLQRSHQAFVDEVTPESSPETLQTVAKGLKFACAKQHLCVQCMRPYDNYIAGEIPGFCPVCEQALVDRAARSLRSQSAATLRALDVVVPDTGASSWLDPATQRWMSLLIGFLAGFIIGGIAAFSTPWI